MLDEHYNLSGNHEMVPVKGEEEEKLKNDFFMYRDGIMIDKTERWILPTNYLKFANLVHKFQHHSSDVVVSTFPKSGSAWVQEIVWNLINNPDLKNPDANITIDARSPSLHGDLLMATTGAHPFNSDGEIMKRFQMLFPGKSPNEGVLLHLTAIKPPPRVIKTHIPLCFHSPNLPDACKVIYVARDPRDVINSLYFFMRLNKLYGFTGTRDEFVDYFLDDKVCFGPYWKHVQHAWEKRDHPNFLFLFYGNMKENIEDEVRKIDRFLGTKRTDEQINNVINFTSFESLKNRFQTNPPSSNYYTNFNKDVLIEQGGFYRKGKVGDWKDNFSAEQVKKINAWMTQNMKHFGNDFLYKPPLD